jgi:3'-phosphoadenosine 5'-phosphosulfate (PAPS) 3'-phosphatase
MNPHQQFAVQLAYQAGGLLMDYFNPFGIQANLKSDRSVVTEADRPQTT